MPLLHALVLGIVQGLTKFLPISSTGHLRIVPSMLGWSDPGAAFSAVIQLGTMAAVVVYFARDIVAVTRGWVGGWFNPARRSTTEYRLGWMIFLGTIPIGIVGFGLKDVITNEARSLELIGFALIAFGLLMGLADRVAKHLTTIDQMRVGQGFAIGVAQTLALIPGVSRSGATISAGLVLGLEREAAARFSFLLSIPAVVLSGLFELKDATGASDSGVAALIVATAAAFVFGYASIAFLLRYLRTHSIALFAIYRIALGVIVLVGVQTNWLS